MNLTIYLKRDTSENFENFIPDKDELIYITDREQLVVGDGVSKVLECPTKAFVGIKILGTVKKPKMYALYDLRELENLNKQDQSTVTETQTD